MNISISNKLRIKPSRLGGEIVVPGSKSHTIRALSITALADGESVILNPLMAQDTLSCISAIRLIGADVRIARGGGTILRVRGTGIPPRPTGETIYVGNSGTTLRILTAMGALAEARISYDGDQSIRQRPMQPLLSALSRLGVQVNSTDGKCPFSLQGPLRGGRTSVDGISSQFVTALLLTLPLARGDSEIEVVNLHEKPYVRMTLKWLDAQQIKYSHHDMSRFFIQGDQCYRPFKTSIGGDFSSATFPLCAAAVTESSILIKGLDFDDAQGDRAVFSILEAMGMEIGYHPHGVAVAGRPLQGMEIDMNHIPDALPALAVVGCFARGRTRLINVEQARLKECDRIAATVTELKKMGADIRELKDGIEVGESRLTGTSLHAYHDHRMVMALTVAGLASQGETIIDSAGSIGVTYPSFVEDMQGLGGQIEIIQSENQ